MIQEIKLLLNYSICPQNISLLLIMLIKDEITYGWRSHLWIFKVLHLPTPSREMCTEIKQYFPQNTSHFVSKIHKIPSSYHTIVMAKSNYNPVAGKTQKTQVRFLRVVFIYENYSFLILTFFYIYNTWIGGLRNFCN